MPPGGRKGIDDLVGGGGCCCIESAAAALLHPLFMLDPSSSDPVNKVTVDLETYGSVINCWSHSTLQSQ